MWFLPCFLFLLSIRSHAASINCSAILNNNICSADGTGYNFIDETSTGCTIGGGRENSVRGTNISFATVSGGASNRAVGEFATVGGGSNNTASGNWASTVSGGELNRATSYASTVSGGQLNTANNTYSTVSGGFGNQANGSGSTVSGGVINLATNSYSTVSGGANNQATNKYSTVSGGFDNQATGEGSTVSGGAGNAATNLYSTVSGGERNQATSNGSTVFGGGYNIAEGSYASVGGGGGESTPNLARGAHSTIPGGKNNTVEGIEAFALGSDNTVGGYSSGAIGTDLTTTKSFATAIGNRGDVIHSHAVVISAVATADPRCQTKRDNQVIICANETAITSDVVIDGKLVVDGYNILEQFTQQFYDITRELKYLRRANGYLHRQLQLVKKKGDSNKYGNKHEKGHGDSSYGSKQDKSYSMSISYDSKQYKVYDERSSYGSKQDKSYGDINNKNGNKQNKVHGATIFGSGKGKNSCHKHTEGLFDCVGWIMNIDADGYHGPFATEEWGYKLENKGNGFYTSGEQRHGGCVFESHKTATCANYADTSTFKQTWSMDCNSFEYVGKMPNTELSFVDRGHCVRTGTGRKGGKGSTVVP